MNCVKCNREFSKDDNLAAISGSIMGDEYTDVYYFCPVCRVFTVANWRDNFTGKTMDLTGPLEEKTGLERVELVRKCSQPWDKKCRCSAHREYFNGVLD